MGIVEPIDDESCVLVTGADTVETVAVYIGMLGIDFWVESPDELVDHLRVVGERYARAVADSSPDATFRTPLPSRRE